MRKKMPSKEKIEEKNAVDKAKQQQEETEEIF